MCGDSAYPICGNLSVATSTFKGAESRAIKAERALFGKRLHQRLDWHCWVTIKDQCPKLNWAIVPGQRLKQPVTPHCHSA
jgi:hypothetical protein